MKRLLGKKVSSQFDRISLGPAGRELLQLKPLMEHGRMNEAILLVKRSSQELVGEGEGRTSGHLGVRDTGLKLAEIWIRASEGYFHLAIWMLEDLLEDFPGKLVNDARALLSELKTRGPRAALKARFLLEAYNREHSL